MMLRLGILVALPVVILDQLTKWWVLKDFMNPPSVIEITPFFNIVLVWNRGVSFGLFDSDSYWGPVLLSALVLVISAALLVWLARASSRFSAVAIGMVLGGAIGNVIDRMRFGAVVDFLDFHAMGYHWPAFNVADSAISIGVGLLLYDGLFENRRKYR